MGGLDRSRQLPAMPGPTDTYSAMDKPKARRGLNYPEMAKKQVAELLFFFPLQKENPLSSGLSSSLNDPENFGVGPGKKGSPGEKRG